MENLEKLAKLIRYYSLVMTSAAGSGHLTSSLSATDLMTALFFGGFFRFNPLAPDYPNNDRIIFSKGHASPLFYSLWAAAGLLSEKELLEYRKFGSPLEGHPTNEFNFTEAPTGSLGQGLSIGLGMALNAKLQKFTYKTYVLLGDSEMAEGSIWEAIELAAHYKLNNLIGIIDVNRLGQSGETMLGWDVKTYQKRICAFGWETIVIDGHNLAEISQAFALAQSAKDKPVMIIAKTIKGKGLKEWENKNGFHAKTIPYEKMGEALKSLGEIDKSLRGLIAKARPTREESYKVAKLKVINVAQYKIGEEISTRKAYGEILNSLASDFPALVVLDAEVSNSTYSETIKNKYPERFLEMYIAEQNMVGTAIGLSKRGRMPIVSTFAAFWTRAHDQIRMAGLANANIKFIGSHAGVSIGQDGASQMGIEDIALFRSVQDSVILNPSDGISTQKLTELAAKHFGLVYIRITRMETPIIYDQKEKFEIGGSKILKKSKEDKVTVIGAGVTLFESLKAYEELKKEGIKIRVIDLYSIKPLDDKTLKTASEETKAIIVVEDHRPEGGIVDAVRSSLHQSRIPVYSLAVNKKPRSGTPEELLRFEEIDSEAIIQKVKEVLR